MGKFTEIIVDLGTAISKSVLKMWLGDSEIATDISASIADILGKKIKDIKPRRPTIRFFERIADEISDSLEPIFNDEFKKVPDNEKKAAIYSALKTFEGITFNDDILFKKNLDPSLLKKYLLDSDPNATRELSSASKSLYERIVNEASHYIIEISSSLPGFSLKSTKELLLREAKLLEKIQEIVENIPAYISSGDFEDSKFETQYRRRVARIFDILQVYGINSDPIFTRYKLSVAYIRLSLSMDFDDEYDSEDEDEDDPKDKSFFYRKPESILGEFDRILIRGEAGSGKTTLLQWIAVNSAKKAHFNNLHSWSNKIPLLIKLREFSSRKFPSPQEIGGEMIEPIKDEMPRGWVHKKLRDGDAIVLIDGVDELQEDRRVKLLDWIEDLVSEYARSTFIVTSRPSAIENNWLNELDFKPFNLEPMGRQDLILFINHWYEAAKDNLADERQMLSIDTNRESLIGLLESNNQIRNLCSNPLLCAITCALNMERNSILPTQRAELYRVSLESLLDRRDSERFEGIQSHIELSYAIKEHFLKSFSFWMMSGERADTSISEFEERIKNLLSLMPYIHHNSTVICKYLMERSGVLRSPAHGGVDFIHKTFQEYLTAKYIANEDLTPLLAEKAISDYWSEVIILFTSLANTKQTDEAISYLLDLADQGDEKRHRHIVLAAVAANQATTLSPHTFKRVRNSLSEILPPTNYEDARKISAANEMVIPYLDKYHSDKNTDTVSACIRALSLIGSNQCLDVLRKYAANNHGDKVSNELVRSWENFDQEEYARVVLAVLNYKGPLEWSYNHSLKGFEYLTALEKIDFSGNSEIRNISNLKCCTQLFKASFRNCENIRCANELSHLINLQYLDLEGCFRINDFSFLSSLSYLKVLVLDKCFHFESLKPLANLKNLESLSLRGCYEIEDLLAIKNMEKLVKLDLGGCHGITNFSIIEELENLEELIVAGSFAFDTMPSLENSGIVDFA